MNIEFYIGQCLKYTTFGQTHYYKILRIEDGCPPYIKYVSFYSEGIYIGEGDNTKIADGAVEIAEDVFDSMLLKVTTMLAPIVEYYMTFPFKQIEDTTLYVDNVPNHPKGQCFVKVDEGRMQFSKLLSPFKYGSVTSESIFVCSKENVFGVYLFPMCREMLNDSYLEIDRKDFTKLKKYTNKIAKPIMWALNKEFM